MHVYIYMYVYTYIHAKSCNAMRFLNHRGKLCCTCIMSRPDLKGLQQNSLELATNAIEQLNTLATLLCLLYMCVCLCNMYIYIYVYI